MIIKNWHFNTYPFVIYFSIFLYLILILSYIFIHKKQQNLTLSTLILFWTVTTINTIHFIFQPLNESLFLFAFIPVILFITINKKRLLFINGGLFYIVLIGVILYNIYTKSNNLHTEFFIVFTLFNLMMIFFGIYYQKTMQSLILSLEESNKINTFLLKETHHRIKNNLNLLSSILALQIDLNNPKEKEFFLNNQQRIESIAKLHEILYKKDTLSKTNLKDYIEQILSLIQKESPKKIEYQLHISQEILNLDTLINLGIIITEIVLNSIKYNPHKKIKFNFIFIKNKTYHLQICENCSLAMEHFQKSFGYELLNMATLNLYGKFSLTKEDDKICYNIIFPLKVEDV